MTENTQNQEVKEEAGCCCQGKCAEEGQACGCEGKEACTGEEAKQPETPEQTIETLQTALKLSEAKVMEHYDLYVRAMAELKHPPPFLRGGSEGPQVRHREVCRKLAARRRQP